MQGVLAAHSKEMDAAPGSDGSGVVLRPLQAAIQKSNARFKVAVLHRRFGKSFWEIYSLFETANNCKLEYPRCHFIATTLQAAEDIGWQMALDISARLPGRKVSQNRLRITWDTDFGRATFQMLSAYRYQKIRGLYSDAAGFDECPLLPPGLWHTVMRPALSDRKGVASFTGTPQGKGFFYDLFTHAQKKDIKNWKAWYYPVTKTNIIDKDEIIDLKATMPEGKFAQEYMLDWNVALEGAYFAKEMNTMENAKRVGKVPFDPKLPVQCSWHLPPTDSASVLFWQEAGDQLRLIDEVWEQQTSMQNVVDLVMAKPYDIKQHHVSEKADADHYASRISYLRGQGLRFKLARHLPLMDGICAAKPVLERTSVDGDKCMNAIEAFRQHHAEFDEVTQAYKPKPNEDWTLDLAGALTTFASAYNPRRSDWSKPHPYNVRRAA